MAPWDLGSTGSVMRLVSLSSLLGLDGVGLRQCLLVKGATRAPSVPWPKYQ
jgi:hypothetical protein